MVADISPAMYPAIVHHPICGKFSLFPSLMAISTGIPGKAISRVPILEMEQLCDRLMIAGVYSRDGPNKRPLCVVQTRLSDRKR